jgi:glycosyltransferase involved in cell wall biosynthesis
VNISAIIPVYNRVGLLPRAIDSILSQTVPVDEIIVVDDGSTDNCEGMIKKNYPQIKFIQQTQAGVSAARNAAINQASGKWIAMLDSDDVWLDHKIEAIQTAVSNHPEVHLFHSDEIWIRKGKRVNPMKKHQKRGGYIFQHCLPLCVISPSASVIRKSLFDKVGLFDENLPACEDYDLWLRICSQFPVHYIDEALIQKYGGHEDQLSRQHWGMDRFRIESLIRLLDTTTLEANDRKAAESVLLKKLEIILKGARKHNNQSVLETFGPVLDQLTQEQNEAIAC